MREMTPRERTLKAINHERPDRVSVDFGGHRSSGIMAIAYAKLKEYLGITTGDIYVYDIPQQLAIIEPPILDRFKVDVIELGRGFCLKQEDWKEWILPDGTPCKIPAYIDIKRRGQDWYAYSDDGTPIAVQRKGSLYFERIYSSFSDGPKPASYSQKNLATAFEKSMWAKLATPPAHLSFDAQHELEEGARRLRNSTPRAINGIFGGSLYEAGGQMIFRDDDWLMRLASNPNDVHRFLDRLLEYHLDNLEKYLSAAGQYIDIITFSDDLGMQTGPQVSRAMYDKFFKPRHAVLWNRAKKMANVKVMLHCCGGVYPLLPSLIEAGLDIINPVQTNCADMEPKKLKGEFGKDMVFWGGGCDTQGILHSATPEQVAADVRERVKIFSPGGGFIFQQIHNIMSNVPPQNIVAMFDAVNNRP